VSRLKLFFGEALRSLTASLTTTIAATMTVLIGMFVLGVFLALGSAAVSWTSGVKKDVVVKVFFDQSAKTAHLNAVRAELDAMPEVRTIEFVSKDDALRLMKERHPELTKNLTSNPFGHAFTVKPNRAEDVEAIASRLEPTPAGVHKVDYQEKTTERVLEFAKVIGFFAVAGTLILLAAATLLIANTIRLSIFSRRREIEVMKLVGATNWFVRGPFMVEGLLCGVVGAIGAVILLVIAKQGLSAVPVIEAATTSTDAVSFPLLALILVAVSLVVGALGSGITLRRFLKV
jgi:cell division transport system permease protein